jgi:L-fuconolactonase
MTVDAHQHFIRYRPEDYPWIDAEMQILQRDFLPDDLATVCLPEGVDATIAVEARQTLEETDWLLGLARANPLIAGVVGWVDLRDPSLEAVLERYAGNGLLKGVRHVLHDEPDDQFMLRADFCRGIRTLHGFNLSYDLLIFAKHLPQALELVRRFPEQPFVIDHIAKPDIRRGDFESWRSMLRPIAEYPSVFCKLSGMVTEAGAGLWRSGALVPYIDTVLELFGPERTMFGSDWPVCTLEGRYNEVYSLVKDAIQELSGFERTLILGETASRFYRLG